MPSTSPNQGLTLPIGSDANDIPGTFTSYNNGVENRLVQRYLNAADRTVRNAAPNTGEVSYLSSTDTHERFNGSVWTPFPGQVVARGSRTTNSSTTGATEIGVLRLDNIPVYAGRAYLIRVNNVWLVSTVATDIVICRLKYTNVGVATTASPEMSALRVIVSSTSDGPILPINANFWAIADETLSIILTVQRAVGTGTVQVNPTAGQTIDIVVQDAGTDPGDTGVDL